MSEDQFNTVHVSSQGTYKDRGSKFKAYLFHCENEDHFKEQLAGIQALDYAARHHCWAYRINPESPVERSNDDGEPSHSAGTPILRALQSSKLQNVGCVVSRTFGGIKLGVPGLIAAYGGAAKDACENAAIATVGITRSFWITFGYDSMSDAENIVRQTGATVATRIQNMEVYYQIQCKKSKLEETLLPFEKHYKISISATKPSGA